MANQQGGSMGGQTGARGSSPDQPTGRQSQSTGETGVRDATYNLISVVYHALQGAETYKQYEEDVERTQDAELAQFFRQACEEEKRRAQQGKELLSRHLQRQGGGGGGQQLQGGAAGQQSSGSSGASRSHQQSQSVPGDQYGRSQSSASGQSSQQGSSGQQSPSGSPSGQMGGSRQGMGRDEGSR